VPGTQFYRTSLCQRLNVASAGAKVAPTRRTRSNTAAVVSSALTIMATTATPASALPTRLVLCTRSRKTDLLGFVSLSRQQYYTARAAPRSADRLTSASPSSMCHSPQARHSKVYRSGSSPNRGVLRMSCIGRAQPTQRGERGGLGAGLSASLSCMTGCPI